MSSSTRSQTKQATPQRKATVHPEMQKPAKKAGVPGAESSRLKPQQGGTDPRTGHDKDGNAEQASAAGGKTPSRRGR